MAERYSFSLRSVKSDRSLRRRSSTTYSKNVQEDTPDSDIARAPSRSSTRASSSSMASGQSRKICTIMENGGTASSQSLGPILRHDSTLKKDVPLPPWPRPSQNPGSDRLLDPDNLPHHERRDDYPRSFSDIPLTPVQISPDLERDGNPFSPYLPTPNFSRQHSIRSRLLAPKQPPAGSQQLTSEHTDSTNTLRAGVNGWKLDAENFTRTRPPLRPGSRSNWTQKWPKPRASPRSLGGLVAAIEESEGLGFDKPDRWTIHKWTLLVSILIGFGYSSVGLAYAMLTWFRGERIHVPVV